MQQTTHQQTHSRSPVGHCPFLLAPAKLRSARQHRHNKSSCAAAAAAGASGRPTAQLDQPAVPHLQHANRQWLQESLNTPLRLQDDADADKVCRVFVLGVCFWAPLQHELVAAALAALSPDEVLVEQPAASTSLLLPHPAWVQTVIDFEQCVSAAGQTAQGQQQQQWWQQQWQEFTSELRSSSTPTARVGKDILDPFESFGYYGGLDFVKQADSIAAVLQLCGFLPGQEVVTAAQHALTQGIPLRCIDASLKLQESWVRGLLSTFDTLDEQTVNSYTPIRDFNANQQLASTLPAAVTAWDKQLAGAAAQLQQQAQQQAAGGGADTEAAAAAAAAAAAEQQALLLFKCSKATAAALLLPDESQQAEVLARMARLQPLKWRHFALRQQYMAQQIKEAAVAAAKSAHAGSSSGSSSNSSSSGGTTLLVIVGRQHCAALRSLWCDPASSLWRTQVPRSFAPSVVDPEAEPTPAASRVRQQPQAGQAGAGDAKG